MGIDGIKWEQQAGPTAFAPSAVDSDYFDKSQQFMLDFRVEDLDGMLEQFKADGVKIAKPTEEHEGMGRFACIKDPEGNRIELWQPAPETQ